MLSDAWQIFCIDILIQLLFLYGTGYFVLRLARADRLLSLTAAPLISIVIVALLATVYGAVGIASTWISLLLIPATIACIAYAVLRGLRKSWVLNPLFTLPRPQFKKHHMAPLCIVFVLSLALAAGIVSIIFLRSIGDPTAFSGLYDNTSHLSAAHALAQKTNWSLLSPDMYTYYAIGQNPVGDSTALTFYPPIWRWLVAIAEQAVPQITTISSNAAVVSTVVFVIPVSIFGLYCYLFKHNFAALVCAMPMTLLFVSYPWNFITFGPLYPNMLSYALIPGALIFFVRIFTSGVRPGVRVGFVSLFVVSCISLILVQPNAIFTCGVLVSPYIMWQFSRIPQKTGMAQYKRWQYICLRFVFFFLGIACVMGIWIACFFAPPLQGLINYSHWNPVFDPQEAFIRGLRLSLDPRRNIAEQVLLAVALWFGLLVMLVKQKRLRWVAFGFIFMFLLYVLCIGDFGWWRHFFTGFWYHDYYRLAGALPLFGAAIVGYGLQQAASFIAWLVRYVIETFVRNKERIMYTLETSLMWAGMVVLVGALSYHILRPTENTEKIYTEANPWVYYYLPLEYERLIIYDEQSLTSNARREQEVAFWPQVRQIVGDAYVINNTYDGSGFAYSQNDVPVLYRSAFVYGENATPDTAYLMEHLADVATNTRLKDYLRANNIHYYMRQYNSQTPPRAFFEGYNPDEWTVFNSVGEHTPGFTKVLDNGEMVLYRISALDE